MTNMTVLITGCSSGFGRLAAERFAEAGWNVVATMRSPERERHLTGLDNVAVLPLDVRDEAQIAQTVETSLGRFGSIDVLVNNAGFGGSTLFEQVSDAAIRAMYDTNVFGAMNVTRAVLPHLREQGSGRIINVTSANGFLGGPTLSIYVSTKFALDGFTESLAHELAPLGILAKTVQPGAFPTTDFGANTRNEVDGLDDDLAAYADFLRVRVGTAIAGLHPTPERPNEPRLVAEKIFECATADTPIHNPVGADAELLAHMLSSRSRQQFLDHITELLFPEPLDGERPWTAVATGSET